MEEYLFNVDNGYLEGLVRGFRSGILTRTDYINLVQCETIEGEIFLMYRSHIETGDTYRLSVLTVCGNGGPGV